MKTVGELLQLSAKFLGEKKIVSPRRTAEELLSHILELSRLDLYMQFDRPLTEQEVDCYREFIKRRASGEPWQYIVGEIDFFHCQISLKPGVLIPRQETEILVSKVLEKLPETPLEVWDICCGSGSIGIALKKARPKWDVTLSDISEEALAVARENTIKNGVSVELKQGDLLQPFRGRKADVVVCNPPYVTEEVYPTLDPSVRDFEPKLALVGGPTGLEFYERLARELPDFLNPHAKVFFEIGTGMGEKVLALFSAPYWISKVVEKDWADHTRFIFLEMQ